MAHTYALYSAPAAAAAAAYAKLTDSGYFDSVTFDDSTNKVTCVKNSETLFEMTYSSGSISWTFGLYTGSCSPVGNFWVGLCDSAVYLGFHGYYGLYTLSIYKSQNGKLMITYKESNSSEQKTTCEDVAVAPSNSNGSVSNNASYSTACPLCSVNGTVDAVSVSKDVYRFVERYTSLPTNSLTFAQIGDARYLTDGFIVMATT